MTPTTETLAPFNGGQLEIHNDIEDYLYRGEIERVEVVGDSIKVHWAWLAKNDGTPSAPSHEWTADFDHPDYAVDLNYCHMNPIDSLGRIIMQCAVTNELCVFFPKGFTGPDGEPRGLDRNRVKGL